MRPNVAIIPAPEQGRKAELVAEARRLARRRTVAEAVARRSLENDRGLRGEASAALFRRARRRATRLGLVFHRSLESLWMAGGFDEALAIFREQKADLARRASAPGLAAHTRPS